MKNLVENAKHLAKEGVKNNLEHLTLEQVHSIAGYQFSNPDKQMVADIFLLCCYTGLYYNDLMELDKGQHKVEIPLLPEANFLLEKYAWEFKGFKNRADKANLILKSVFEILGLPQHYSFRTGRKTFLTTMLNEYQFSQEAVIFMAGYYKKRLEVLPTHSSPNSTLYFG